VEAGNQPGGAIPIGVATLSKMAFDGEDLNPIWETLVHRFVYEPDDAAALMDLSIIEQIFGNREIGISHQTRALEIRQLYPSRCAVTPPSLRLLAFAAPGDIGANTPLEFLLAGSDIALETLYVAPGVPLPVEIPEHDVAIVSVAQSAEHAAVLAMLSELGARWPRPLLNAPERVALLSRERLHALLAAAPGIAIPATSRITRAALAGPLADGGFPLIVRPIDSHAGVGLAKLDEPAAIASYLAERGEAEFTISSFVDYRSADGLFRKYRIVFVGGRPYACHMAIADQWAIWYLNAGMKDDAAKRAEEAHFMTAFDADFGRRHAAALAEIESRIGLDYFAIDCAETADGKLLVFEADIAMIVHDMDPAEIFPYKAPQMRKVFRAFRAMLRRASRDPASAA